MARFSSKLLLVQDAMRVCQWGLFVGVTVLIAEPSVRQNGETGEMFNLSPFELKTNEEKGYQSTYALSALGLNQPVGDTAFAIEIINAKFLDDLAATDFSEALEYSSGVFLEDFTAESGTRFDGGNVSGANEVVAQSGNLPLGGLFDNAATIRGFNAPHVYRDGFRYGGVIPRYEMVLGGIVDISNVARMEVVRGPNAVIFGNGSLSGFVNIIAKRPSEEAAQEISFSFGNYDFLRTTLDVTGPLAKDFLGGQLNYRVSAALESRGHWTDWRGKELDHYVGQLEWQSEKMSLLLEGQYADQREKGIGDPHVFDNLSNAIDQDFRNEFGEHINWTKELGEHTDTYRITGPDTFHLRRENNFLADLEVRPLEHLSLSAGLFITDAREEEFNVNLSTITNAERRFDLRFLEYRANDPNTEDSRQILNWLDRNVTVFPNEHVQLERIPGDPQTLEDHRVVRYWWEEVPEVTTTEQYRIRAVYDFESGFIGDSTAKHRFLVGRHDLKDVVDFTVGDALIDNQYAIRPIVREWADDDPLQVRNIKVHSVIRYNGEALALPGNEFRLMEVWTSRHYAQYQGRFLDERIGIVFGLNRERFHARDRRWDRFDEDASFGPEPRRPPIPEPPYWMGPYNPYNETFGFFDYDDDTSFFPPLSAFDLDEVFPSEEAEKTTNRNIALSYRLGENVSIYGTRSEGLLPHSGLRDGNGEYIPAETSSNEEMGIKFNLLNGRLTGTVSTYRITRKNASWYLDIAPAPVKWGQIRDLGFEPSLVTDRDIPISYGIDRYYFDEDNVELRKIRREILDDDGNPIRIEFVWPEGLLGLEGFGIFGARQFAFLDYSKLDLPAIDRFGNDSGNTWRYYLEKAFADRDRSGVSAVRRSIETFDPLPYARRPGTTLDLNPSERRSRGANVTYTDQSEGVDMQLHYAVTNNWQMVFSYAHTEREAIGGLDFLDTVDLVSGASFGTEYDIWVRTFGREAFGLVETDIDGDGIVDTVTKNGQPIGVGDVRPTDLVHNLEGVNLYTGSEDSASLWTNYRFTEGRLGGLDASLGAIYRSPAETSSSFGGENFDDNSFSTPPTPDYFKIDAALRYQWMNNQRTYTLQLNVYNLLDERTGKTVANYTDNDGAPLKRRTQVFYEPRSYRLSISVRF